MNNDKKLQAKHLFFQTELSKSQIAHVLNISRRSLHYWVREGDWQRLKNAATHLPSLLAENCYHIIGHLTNYYLSERRITNPVTHKEADTLYKLTLTVNKLKNRSTLNENMEMFAFFLDGLKMRNPRLAEELLPHVDDYINARASVYQSSVMPQKFNPNGRLPFEFDHPNALEEQLDNRDLLEEDMENEHRAALEKQEEVLRQSELRKAQAAIPEEAKQEMEEPKSTVPDSTKATDEIIKVCPSPIAASVSDPEIDDEPDDPETTRIGEEIEKILAEMRNECARNAQELSTRFGTTV